ncbi:hypothetical protein ACFWOT_20250 [Streptomyces sp. NPDC058440]|uniref:hypothetical protein n=1 Tax=Streptomyces sp. NPDC058440 TaxID=3346501 RepID=UPI00365603B6
MRLSDEPQRYYLTLTVDVRIVLQGWWASEATARWKFSGWVGEYGNLHAGRRGDGPDTSQLAVACRLSAAWGCGPLR